MVHGFLPGDRVPAVFIVGRRVLLGVDNGGERRGNDHSLDCRRVGLDGLQDARSALDSGIQEVLDGVLDIEVEGRCSVQNVVEWRVGFDGLKSMLSATLVSSRMNKYLVKGSIFRNILHNNI